MSKNVHIASVSSRTLIRDLAGTISFDLFTDYINASWLYEILKQVQDDILTFLLVNTLKY